MKVISRLDEWDEVTSFVFDDDEEAAALDYTNGETSWMNLIAAVSSDNLSKLQHQLFSVRKLGIGSRLKARLQQWGSRRSDQQRAVRLPITTDNKSSAEEAKDVTHLASTSPQSAS